MSDSSFQMTDPRLVIFDFLKNLPDTIRTEELAFILLYGTGHCSPEESDNFISLIEQYLMRPGYRGVGAVICAMAIIDRRFGQSTEKLEKAQWTLKNLSNDMIFSQDVLSSLPLKKEHYSQAMERWKTLKEGPLAENNIRDYERNPLN